MKKTISVVIATHNSEEFIRSTINSVLTQTLLPEEIIIVDDCSCDNTIEILETIAAVALVPVRVIRLDRNSGGPAAPLNRGIEAAKGNLIATLDHDDWMLPDKLKTQQIAMKHFHDIGLSFSLPLLEGLTAISPIVARAADIIRDLGDTRSNETILRIDARKAYCALVSSQFTLSCSSMVFPKTVWSKVRGFDESMKICCDSNFIQKITKSFDIAFVQEPLYYWNLRENSHSKTSSIMKYVDEYIKVMKDFESHILSVPAKLERKRSSGEHLLTVAYRLRESGNYEYALRYYIKSLPYVWFDTDAILGLVKLVPHWLLFKSGVLNKDISDFNKNGQG